MWWQKLLVEWPVQLLRRLMARVPLAVLREKITWRKIVFTAVLLVAMAGLAQLLPLDMALFMAGDLAFYCEIAAAVMFIVVRGHIRYAVMAARLALSAAAARARLWCRRCSGARQRRTRKDRSMGDDSAGDGDGPAGVWGLAMA